MTQQSESAYDQALADKIHFIVSEFNNAILKATKAGLKIEVDVGELRYPGANPVVRVEAKVLRPLLVRP